MNDERRARIKKRLAAITSSRWTMRMLSDPNEEEIHFIANAPADIRDLLDDNAALAQAQAQELAALRALLAGAPELLGLAAKMAEIAN